MFDDRVMARFWAKVDKRGPNECWPWKPPGEKSDGRGVFWLNGGRIKAPRMAWQIANGKTMDAGLFACHSCDNPPCCNPAHIWAGTIRDNVMDAIAKRRHSLPPLNSGMQRINRSKTHCVSGHAFDEANTCWLKTGWRSCRACQRRSSAATEARLGYPPKSHGNAAAIRALPIEEEEVADGR